MKLRERLRLIQDKIDTASKGRKIKLIGVSKTFPAEIIQAAYEAGLHVFGENRVQEGVPKVKLLENLDIEWHFIGHLQTNKTRDAVQYFSWIQSVDSVKLLHEIEKHASKLQKRMNLMLEVNLGGEESKHGFEPDELHLGLETGKTLEWSKILGLMAIPPYIEDPELVRPYFQKLREILSEHSPAYPDLIELSMGMSHDYEIAIQEGATMIRLGTALFGTRYAGGT